MFASLKRPYRGIMPVELTYSPNMFDSFSEAICAPVDGEGPFASLGLPNDVANLDEVHDSLPLCDIERPVVEKKQPKGRVRWTVSETLTLINAKQAETNLQSSSCYSKHNKSAIEKWKVTSAQCHSNGLHRTATQCRDRWDHIQPDYKKIRHYERSISSEHESYWNLNAKERTDRNLPGNFTKEIFDAMERHFGQNRMIHPGDMVIDTSASNYGPCDGFDNPAEEGLLHRNMKHESLLDAQEDSFDGDPTIDHCKNISGKKQKVSSTSGVKSALAESYRKLASNIRLGEQGQLRRHEKYCSMLERKMEMDDKYLKDHTINMQKMLFIEEQKVRVQQELVSALNSIGQAMLKISDTIGKKD